MNLRTASLLGSASGLVAIPILMWAGVSGRISQPSLWTAFNLAFALCLASWAMFLRMSWASRTGSSVWFRIRSGFPVLLWITAAALLVLTVKRAIVG